MSTPWNTLPLAARLRAVADAGATLDAAAIRQTADEVEALTAARDHAWGLNDRARHALLMAGVNPVRAVVTTDESEETDWYEAAEMVNMLRERAERAELERDNWRTCSEQFARNIDYYRSLLDACAPHLAPGIYTQDDGGIVTEPLRAKVPELVTALASERDRWREYCQGARETVRTLSDRLADAAARPVHPLALAYLEAHHAEQHADLVMATGGKGGAPMARARAWEAWRRSGCHVWADEVSDG